LKLNGWQRIGIIASVLWVICGFFYTFSVEEKSLGQLNADIHAPCFESAHDDAAWKVCEDAMMKQAMSDLHFERTLATVVAFVPIPLAWGFVYLVLFLVRWIRRGFARTGDLR
jgi:hypothetical protein